MNSDEQKARRSEAARRWKIKNPERYAELQRRARDHRRARGLAGPARPQCPGKEVLVRIVDRLAAGETYSAVARSRGVSEGALRNWTAPWVGVINKARGPTARQAALVAGEARYLGKICLRHPVLGGQRYTSSRGKCPGCVNEAKRLPHRREKERARQRARYAPIKEVNAADREVRRAARVARKAAERAAREEAKNGRRIEMARRKRERKARDRKAYYAANPAKKKVLKVRRRARERGAVALLTPEEARRVEDVYADARRRTAESGRQWDVHHIVPLSRGGAHHPDNLEVAPAEINNAIGDKPLSVMEYILS